jgi:hypothetical protein
MHKLTQVFVFAPLASLSTAALAQRPAPAVDGYAVFSEMRANAPVGSCNCFWMYGAHGGFSLPMWRDFSVVIEAAGHHNSQIPNFNTGLSIFYDMGGLRCAWPTTPASSPSPRDCSAACTASTATSPLRSAGFRPATIRRLPLPWAAG